MEKSIKIAKEINIKNQFTLLTDSRLGSGSFGQIFKGYSNKTKEEVAIKIESNNSPTPQLMHEYKILNALQEGDGFPKIYLLTPLDDTLVMVFELLGSNLEQLMLNQPKKKFNLKTVLMISIQILKRIQFLHQNYYIHRDIKPENFAVGFKKKNTMIYMIDYGLSRKYYDPKTKEHIPYKEGKSLTGTARFASIYTHLGIEQSRRDDLESLGYLMIYFLVGDLPWNNLKAKTKKEKYNKIKEKKIEVTPDILCQGFDNCFKEYFKYVRKLQFEEEPNYDFLLDLLNKLMKKENFINDLNFDWCEKKSSSLSFGGSSSLFSAEALFSKLKIQNEEKKIEEKREEQKKNKNGEVKKEKEKEEKK